MTKRGVQLQSELRWLNPRGGWTLDNELLSDRERDGDWRHFTRLRHAGTLGSRWRTGVEYSTVSDDEYFEDLGNSLQRASVTHLEQRAELVYEDRANVASVRVQAYETVDATLDTPAERPYRRVPQVAILSEYPPDARSGCAPPSAASSCTSTAPTRSPARAWTCAPGCRCRWAGTPGSSSPRRPGA